MALAMNVCRVTHALPAPDRAGVDNGNVCPIADNPRLRARIGIRRSIGCQNAPHERLMLLNLACCDGVGPFHSGDMAHNEQKKKGRPVKTAPAEPKRDAGGPAIVSLLVDIVRLRFELADLVIKLFHHIFAHSFGHVCFRRDVTACRAQVR